MTWTPNAPFGTGANIIATVDLTVADFGSSAGGWPHSPNYSSSRTSTQTELQTANSRNLGTKPPPH
jgi:hypothetical protein